MAYGKNKTIPDTDITYGTGCLAVLAVGALVVAVVAFLGSFHPVDAGEACAVTTWGAVERGDVLGPGINFRNPLSQSVHCYRTRVLVYDVDDNSTSSDYNDKSEPGQTADGLPITIAYGVRYHIPISNVATIYQSIGADDGAVNEKVVKFPSISLVRNNVQGYPAETLYSGQLITIENRIAPQLAAALAEKGVVLDSFVLRKITFNQAFTDSMNAKAAAQQNALKAKYDADAAVAKAKGEASAEVEQAKGDAQAIELRGQALAKYPQVLQQQFIDKLDKATWMMVPNTGITPFVQFPQPKKEAQ